MSTLLDRPSERILDPVVQSLTREVAERILAVRIEPAVQERANLLAKKATGGELTDSERDEYERIIEQADLLGILKSLARRSLAG
jgi:YD repeat-containing protein